MESTPLFAAIRRCLKERGAEQLETTIPYPDGTNATFQLGVQSVPEGVFILSLDITDANRRQKHCEPAWKSFAR